MIRRYTAFAGIILILVCFIVIPVHADNEDEDIRRMPKEEVKALIGQPNVTVIDVRYDKNWKKSDMKIAGAVREHPNEIGSWVGKYAKGRMIILYCD